MRTGLSIVLWVGWLGITLSQFSRGSQRLGTPHQHNGRIPRDFGREEGERAKILASHDRSPWEGSRRWASMRLDAAVVAVSPSRVDRAPTAAGKLAPRGGKPSPKGTGFEQPLRPHEHWHVDVSYLTIGGTCVVLCSILDGSSRFVVPWEIRVTRKDAEVETIIQRAREPSPGEHPRIITDHGPQFLARDFKEFLHICGMTQVKPSPYYPQSNGTIARWFKALQGGCIRVTTPLNVADARRLVAAFVTHYDTARRHSAIAYITPADQLAGRAAAIWAARRAKLAQADARRRAQAEEKECAQSRPAELQ